MANSIGHASLPYPIKGAKFSVFVPYLDADGDPTDPTTPDTEISKDGAAFADCAEEVSTITGSNGAGWITLNGDELNCSLAVIAAKVASGPKATLLSLVPRIMRVIESGTAQAGGATSITLASGASSINTAYTGMFVKTTGGTGGGGGSGSLANQARRITAYVGSTKVATVDPAWETNPDATTTYEVLRPESVGVTPTDVQQIAGTAVTAASGRMEVNVTHFAGTAATVASGIPQASLTTAAINSVADQVWDEAMSGHVTGGSFGAAAQANHSGTMQAGSASTTAVLASGASASNDYYNNALLAIVSGTGAGQSQYISDYVGATRTATMNGTWVTTPDNTSVYAILPGGTIPGASAPSAADNAAAVWNALTASYVAAGSFGERFMPIRRNTAQAGTSSSITLDASASATTDLYKYSICYLLSGTGVGQARQITAYNGTTKVATVAPAFTVTPSSDSVFVILPLGIDAATVEIIADAVWDEARGDHVAAGSMGEYVRSDGVRVAGSATSAANLAAATDGTGYAFPNCTIPTVTTLTGHTAQTGDAFARLGAPAGASVSADIAAVKSDSAAILVDTGTTLDTAIAAILADTGTDGVVVATASKSGYALSNAGIDALYTRQLTEAYAADGAAPTVAQALLQIQQMLTEFSISSTTLTVKKLDGTTTAFTLTLNDASAPTAITRAT